jgi:hypothetical protein
MFTDSKNDIFDEVTHPDLTATTDPVDRSRDEYLIVVRKGKRVVSTYCPQERNITLGRSRKNSIILPDPSFSRRAGEIILGLVPHYRKTDKGDYPKTPTPMLPGKEYPFSPYTVRLMEPGSILVNRTVTNKRPRRTFILLTGTIILTTAIWSVVTWHEWRGEIPESSIHTSLVEEEKVRAPDAMVDNPGPEKNEKDEFSEKKTEEIELPQESTPIKRKRHVGIDNTPLRSNKPGKVLPIVTNKVPDLLDNVPDGIQAREFEVILSRIKTLLEADQMTEVFRVLDPIASLTSEDQRVQIIETIDPLLQELFRKAYMLKNFERAESIKILNEIVTCRLQFLPAWQKAKRLLDGFRETSMR